MEVDIKYNLSELRSNNNLWTYWGFKSCKLALISIDINWLFLKNTLLGILFRNLIQGIFLILRKGSISNDKMIDLKGGWISRKKSHLKIRVFCYFQLDIFLNVSNLHFEPIILLLHFIYNHLIWLNQHSSLIWYISAWILA